MRKHGLKSSAKRERLLAAAEDEAEEALDKLASPSFAQPAVPCRVVYLKCVYCCMHAVTVWLAHTASCALFDAGGGGVLFRSAPSAAVFV